MARSSKSTRTKVVIASLIASTSLIAAVAAWRASLASGDSGDADRKAFDDTVAREQARARIRSDLAGILIDYIRAQDYGRRARALREQARKAGADAPRLRVQAAANAGLQKVTRAAIDRDALRPDGTLDLDRKFAVEYRLAQREADLDPAPEFAASDEQSTKSERLVGLTALLVAAAFFFTLAQVSRRRAYLVYLAGGGIVLTLATALLVTVEVAT